MGPLVTQRLLLMQGYGLRMVADDLFGKEVGQKNQDRGGSRKKKVPYGLSLWEARAEVIDPNYAAKCAEADKGAFREKAGGKSGFTESFKRLVATEGRIASAAALYGEKEAAVHAVADKFRVNSCTLWIWMKKYAPKSR